VATKITLLKCTLKGLSIDRIEATDSKKTCHHGACHSMFMTKLKLENSKKKHRQNKYDEYCANAPYTCKMAFV